MPNFVAALGVKVAGFFGVTGISNAAALTIGSIYLAGTAVAIKKVRDLGDANDTRRRSGREFAIRATDMPRQIVYGEAKVGGLVTFMNTSGTELRELYIEIVHAGHEVDSFQGWFIDDKYIPIADVDDIQASPAGDGGVDADSNNHGFGPVDGDHVMYLRGHLGTSTQAVDSQLDSEFVEVTSTHRHRGCARTNARFDMLEGADEVYDGIAPQSVAALIRGKSDCYDPRLDTSPGADPTNASYQAYTRNPALIWANYRTDTDLGCGWAHSRIDYQSVADAADVCDADVSIPPVTSPPTTRDRFQCNLVLSTGDPHDDNIAKILATMDGRERQFNGQWHVYASEFPATDFALTEDDLVRQIDFRKQPRASERYNRVRGTYFDADRRYKRSQFLTVVDSALTTSRDASEELPKSLELEGVTNEYHAQLLAFRKVNQADNTGICVFATGYQGADIRIGDTGTVTVDELGWSAKVFRVIDLEWRDFEGFVLTLQEDSSAAYADPAVGDYGTRTAAGQIDFPRVRPVVTRFSGNLVPDPFFDRTTGIWDGTAGEHEKYHWTHFVGAANNDLATISRTGGIAGTGVLTLTTDGSAADQCGVDSVPNKEQLALNGEYVQVRIRLRRTAAVTVPSPDATLFRAAVGLADPTARQIWDQGNEPIFTLDHATINAWTLNAWQTFAFVQEVGDPATAPSSLGTHAIVHMLLTSDNTATIEVDAITVERIETPP